MTRNVELDDCRVVASHLDPENKEGDADKQERMEREGERVTDWIEGVLNAEDFMTPLRRLIEEDSEAFQVLMEAYEFDDSLDDINQAAGVLARALKRQIKRTA